MENHGCSIKDGRVSAEDRERLVALHGKARGVELVVEIEAQYRSEPATTKPQRRKATNRGLKPRTVPASAAPDTPTENKE